MCVCVCVSLTIITSSQDHLLTQRTVKLLLLELCRGVMAVQEHAVQGYTLASQVQCNGSTALLEVTCGLVKLSWIKLSLITFTYVKVSYSIIPPEIIFVGKCRVDADCHEKKACLGGICVYPCKRGSCNESLEESCHVYNHTTRCIGKF